LIFLLNNYDVCLLYGFILKILQSKIISCLTKKDNMYSKFFTALFILFSISFYGQNINVSGNVTEASTGQPLPGVNIIIKNTLKGTSTDFEGSFVLNDVPTNSILVISYVGFMTKEIKVINSQKLNIALVEDAEALNEVVIIGYGTQKKKEVTGAVSVISSQTIEKLKPQRIEQAIQGQVAGVNITSASGSPGSGLNINIRGISTNGDNRPLILVDGNVIEDLSVLDPNNIESINILKDATAGIYGVRAANGVILIKTKSGRKEMPTTIEFNSYGGFQQTTRKIPVLNATEYGLLLNESFAAVGQSAPFPNVSMLGQGTNWQDEVFESAAIYNTSFNLRGGNKNSTYAYGTSFLTQDGIVGGNKSNFTRLTKSLNYSLDFLENFKFNAGVIWTHTTRRALNEGGIGSVLFNALNMAPTLPVYNDNGSFSIAEGLGNEVINPIAQIQNTYNRTSVDRISGNAGLGYNFLEHFSAQANYQFNYSKVTGKTFRPIAFFGSGKVFNTEKSQVTETADYFRDYTFDAFIKYENLINDTHKIDALIGTSIFKTEGEFKGKTGFDIPGNLFSNANIDQASDVENINAGLGQNPTFDSRLLSYFTRLQYNFKGKYLISAVLRRDGSSNFGPENKFGYFPSFSTGWVMSDESFLSDSNLINFLKLRGSYGILGNDRIGAFGYVSILDGEATYVFNNTRSFGVASGRIANPEIRWEKQKTFDIGVDTRLWDNKIDLTVDYYNRRTEDLLVSPQVTGIIGAAGPGALAPIVNAGIVENSGLEFAIGYKEQLGDDFNLGVNFNMTTINNEVIAVSGENSFLTGGAFGIGQDPPSRMEAGKPIGYFYGLKTNGIFQSQAQIDNSNIDYGNVQPGDLIFVDSNNDGLIDEDDRTNIGDPIPDFTMGLNISFEYKNFDFAAYAFASVGNEIVRNYERNEQRTNRSIYYLDRWTGEGSTNSFPRVTSGANENEIFSDFYVEDGSFVRLQNVQLGYSLGEKTLENTGLSNLRFYISASNLLTLTKYRGYDPTTTSGGSIGAGIDYGFYPNPRTFLLGINLKF
jgi:TonB-linked SusC/RagA family outer membrane protein